MVCLNPLTPRGTHPLIWQSVCGGHRPPEYRFNSEFKHAFWDKCSLCWPWLVLERSNFNRTTQQMMSLFFKAVSLVKLTCLRPWKYLEASVYFSSSQDKGLPEWHEGNSLSAIRLFLFKSDILLFCLIQLWNRLIADQELVLIKAEGGQE